jgi:hypothetical protein|tara:strand:+ start:40 stop:441 length:402 start_codon:yes stop_codon:yes gene_type:complete
MSTDTETPPEVHPFSARIVGMREAFVPELSDQELRQINDIALKNPELTDAELNAKVSSEFGLQERYDAGVTKEQDIDAMTSEIKSFLTKWRILPMVDPQLVAGAVLHNLTGLSAVFGGFIEDKMSGVDTKPAE